LEIYAHIVKERQLDREKNSGAVEIKYMEEQKAILDAESPERKRQKISREDDDVEMPIYDMAGVLVRRGRMMVSL
jgi:hypothetical protein